MSSQTVFVTAGKTSFSHDVALVQKAAATSPGDPITGLAFNTSSFTAYYRIPATGTLTAITLATQTVGGAFSSGGFVEVSSTNAPGMYRFDVPNAVLATAGVSSVTFNGAANQATHTIFYVCLAVDLFANTYVSSNTTVWNGTTLTGRTGPLREFGIIDAGTAQAATGTTLQIRSAATLADGEAVGATAVIASATTGALQGRVVTANTGSTDTLTVDTWTTTPTGTIVYDVFAGSPASTTVLPPVNATQFAGQTITAAAGVTLPSSVASPTNITAGTITTVTNLTNAPTAGDLTATMKTSVTTAATAATPTAAAVTGAVGSVTGNVGGNVTGSVGSLTTTAIDSILTRAMTESYAADGSTMTVAQALYLIAQTIGEFSVSGTTVTVKKLDGSTSAATYTLDSSTAPTSRTRAT